jgi:hypothetical protein
VIRKAIITGISIFVVLFLINAGLSELFRNRIVNQSKESVSIISVFTFLSGIKISISEFYNANGQLPESNKELGIGTPESFSQRWIKSVTIGPSGRIDAALKEVGNNPHIYLYPTDNANKLVSPLSWRCYAKGIRQNLLDVSSTLSCISLASNEYPPKPKRKKKSTVEDLISAVREKRNGYIRILIKKKTDVNGRNAAGESPLRVAIEYADNYSVQLLVSAGAKVNEVIRDQKNKTLLMLATENRTHGGLKIRQLLNAGAEIEARDETDKTALIHAAINNDIEAVRALLEHDADVSSVDHKGQTAKDYAALLHGKGSRVYRRLALTKKEEKDFIYRLPGD